MSKVYNFDTQTGIPIKLNGSEEPAFYIYPDDLDFIEKATELYHKVGAYQKEVAEKYKDVKIEVDEEGVPINTGEVIDIMKEEFNTQLSMIDELLGEGVTDKVFNGKMSIPLLSKFMNFLSATIKDNRSSTIEQYVSPNRAQRRAAAKVMK